MASDTIWNFREHFENKLGRLMVHFDGIWNSRDHFDTGTLSRALL